MKTVVLSAPGRASVTRATLEHLNRQNPGQALEVFRSTGIDPIGDFWAMLRAHAGSGDLLALEDDVITARNFIAYVRRWRSPYLTSFFFMGGGGLETGRPEWAGTFGGNQALWFPAGLVLELARRTPVRLPGWLQDNALGCELQALGEPVWYHRSLVQHRPAPSLAAPRRGWYPTAVDFVGENYDCLSLCSSSGASGSGSGSDGDAST